jgi:hypothetical protein
VGEEINAYRVLVGEPKGKSPLRRSRHKWDDSMKIEYRNSMGECTVCIHLIQDRDLWQAIVNMIVP